MIWKPPRAACAPPSRAMICALSCARISSPGRQGQCRRDIAHRARGHEHRRLFAEQVGDALAEQVDGRIVAELFVADSARAIASRIPAVGRVWVSDSRLMRMLRPWDRAEAGV